MVSQLFSFKAAAAILSAVSVVNAHMIMQSPVPYGKSSLNNSPLAGDGSDFPCKQRAGVYEAEGASNVMAIGEPQTLSFIGSAVHGGGSCQVSLSTDLQPTKDSKWMVIHSIEGGCPSNVTGNLDADPSGQGAADFQYTIPEGVAPGDYTIAWSWVNKIGNREFYMNCGPATVTAPKKKRYAPAQKIRRQSSFPDMFVANLQGVSNGCATAEGVDVQFPNPGDSVEKGSINVNLQTPSGCGAAVAQAAGSGSGSGAAASASAASGASSADTGAYTASSAAVPSGAADSAPAPARSGSNAASSVRPGVFATGAASASSAAPAEAASTAVVQPVPAATAASSGSSSGNSSGSSTSAIAGGACTNEGAWSCAADGSSFQRCASGAWSASMAMPQGMKCTPGESDTLGESPSKRHISGHIRRSHRFALS